jgi:hypothetical protein
MKAFVVLVTAMFAACSGAPDFGDSCVTDASCPSGSGCFGVGDSGLRLCLARCEPLTTALCTEAAEGSAGACVALDEGGACFTGGEAVVGEPCTSTVDCEEGALCVIEGSEGRCRYACDFTAPECALGHVCSSLGAGVRGYCAPAGDAP